MKTQKITHLQEETVNIDLSKIKFNRVISVTPIQAESDTKIYDLEVDEIKNYVTSIGIAHNGGGKRAGSLAVYLEPWHSDLEDFLELKNPQGKDEVRARDLFYALWVPDMFMERVKEDGIWSLMCPDECPNLTETYGDEFNALYTKYENEGKYRKQVKARELWTKILDAQIETGTPYVMFKDNVNRQSNQKNIGIIRSSNLCSEIVEHTNVNETAVCNLSSISLPAFLKEDGTYDFKELEDVAYHATLSLNRVIDVNFYPTPETKYSNFKHRPIGIGIQGLADLLFKLKLDWDSQEARLLNKNISETIYYGALKASSDLAERDGAYETFKGSPASEGMLQFDLWGVEPSDRYDWVALKEKIKKVGLRNSLLCAYMPTASTSQILGNFESFEPAQSNAFTRRTNAGEFQMINEYLVKELVDIGLWNDDMRNSIVKASGSVQNIDAIPQHIKNAYKTIWEIGPDILAEYAIDRGPFVDQAQSMNMYWVNPKYNDMTRVMFSLDNTKKQQPVAVEPIISQPKQQVESSNQLDEPVSDANFCSLDNPDACVACSG
jgi:ribonucleoside-diphosphate reductase alpha chain